MYYKVLKDNRVVDVLERLVYIKWSPECHTMILCDEKDAQAILSSRAETAWHDGSFYNVPDDAPFYETVELVRIEAFEYNQLKVLNGKTAEQIVDDFVLSLLENNII